MIEITAELQNGSRKSSTVEEACAVSLRCFYTTGDSRKCGFDWFRIGDNGDIPFKECVGFCWDKGHKISDPYIYDKAQFKPDKDLQNTLQGNYKVLKDVFWRNGYIGKRCLILFLYCQLVRVNIYYWTLKEMANRVQIYL